MNIPLTKAQREVMSEFYLVPHTKVVLDKAQRTKIWDYVINTRKFPTNYDLIKICPALHYEILKSKTSGNNIQSAVFSECSFAQTLANMFKLGIFANYAANQDCLTKNIILLLNSYNMTPRYVYSNIDKSRVLIQAGGCGGVDSALISVVDTNVYTIEFKEAGAKTSEPDLPKYGEDGKLIITQDFSNKYPQFINMLNEHIGLSIFDNLGHNKNNFTIENIKTAISNNYNAKKFADVICTEDVHNYLTMLPANQVSEWADLEGEIRPTGRNPNKVWTPIRLNTVISSKGGTIKQDGTVEFPISSLLQERMGRGSSDLSSKYKIDQIFIIKKDLTQTSENKIKFNIKDVQQIRPTISAKLFFNSLDVNSVHEYYKGEF